MMTQWFQMMILGNVKMSPSLPAKMTSVMALMLGMLFCLSPSPTQAGGVVSTCNEASLTTALTGGGTVTFSCDGTITLASTLTISSDTVIDGTGHTVTISGSNAVRVFQVNSGYVLSLIGLTVTEGKVTGGNNGGGISNAGTLNILNCTLFNNTATFAFSHFAGGVYNTGTLNIANSTFSNNSTGSGGSGGGVHNAGGNVNIANSTFSSNSAGTGGGINSSSGTVNITNSIVAGNTATSSGPDVSGTFTSQGYNLIGNNSGSTGFTVAGDQVNVSPNLGSLTGTPAYYPLNSASLAINAGNPSGCTYLSSGTNPLFSNGATITTDQRGYIRNQPRCDIGAYEFCASPPNYLKITEIMYDPEGSTTEPDWEWVEIYNASSTTVDLTGYVLDDGNSIAHSSTNIASGTIPANKTAILYNATSGVGVTATDFTATWGKGINLIAVSNWNSTTMQFNNAADKIGLWGSFTCYSGDHQNQFNVIDNVSYSSGGTWPSYNDKASIYLTDLTADNNVGSNWGLSTVGGSTPLFTGYQSTACCSGSNTGNDIGSPGPNPRIFVSPTTLTLTEGDPGSNVTFMLSMAPSANVTFGLSSNTQCTISAPDVTLTSGNWSTGATVTVTAINDAIDDGNLSCDITTTADTTTTDNNYNGTDPADVTVTVNDNDTAGITVSSPVLSTINELGGTTSTTFTIKLNSQPANGANVTIPLTTPSGQCSVSPTDVTLNNATWSTLVPITITAQNDAIADGTQTCTVVTGNSTSSDANYNGVSANPANVNVFVQDNDVAGLIVSPTTLDVSEPNGTINFNIKLKSEPTAPVTINLSASPTTECTVPATVTLPIADWNTNGVNVTVSAVDDNIAEVNKTCTISITASSYTTENPTVTVTVHDNDTPGTTFTQSSGSTNVAEGGGTDTYTLALNTAPASDVTLTITTNGQVEVSENGTTFSTTLPVIFSNTSAKIITVRAVDDTTVEGTHTSTITHAITTGDGANYPLSLTVPPVTVNITDNDATPPPTPPTPPTPPPVTPTDPGYPILISPTVRLFVTIDGSGQGEVTSETGDLACDNNEDTCQAVYDFGTTVTLLPKPKPGSIFSSWGGHKNCVGGDVLMTGNTLCIAFFRKQVPPQFPLSVTKMGMGTIVSTPAGIDCGEDCQNEYEEDLTVTLLATPAEGWQSVNWTGDCGGTSESVTVTMRQANNCAATFAQLLSSPVSESPPPSLLPTPSYWLTVTKMGDGNGTIISDPALLNCGTQCSGEWVSGTLVNLMVTTEADSLFIGWQGDCQGEANSLAVTMDAVKNCIAVFDRLKPLVPDEEVSSAPLPVVQEEESEENVVITPEEIPLPIPTPVLAPVVALPVEMPPSTPVESYPPLQPTPVVTVPVTSIAWDTSGLPCPPTENWLDWVCNAHWATLKQDLAIGTQGSLSQAIITGVVDSQGWVSNLKILPNAIVQGGIVTGYITNAGRLENIEFRGASLTGGELAGVILNTSKIGGTIQDVSLVANAYLRGGKLAGRIVGDPDAPALLEKLSVKTGSYLESVRIGEGVKMEKGVTLGEGVGKE